MSETRTPPALKWLLNKYARLLGEVEKLERKLPSIHRAMADEIERTEQKLAELKRKQACYPADKLLELRRRDLTTITASLQLHHIQIDPGIIAPIRSQTAERLLGHGELSRFIYQYLKYIYPDSATANEVTIFINTTASLELDEPMLEAFRNRVRHRLKNLAYEGKILSAHERRQNLEGRWRLHSAKQVPD